jgi:hypothetical protein
MLRRRNAAARMSELRLPQFLIIGAARAGTTSLYHYLMPHPGVFLAQPKEIDFFSDDGAYARGIDWYAAHFRSAPGDVLAGEATPRYLASEEAPARIAQTLPRVKLVALLRHPVERAHSEYLMNRTWRGEPRTFDQAVQDELQGRHAGRPRYLRRAFYVEHLERYARHFSPDALHVALFDDLASDPLAVYRGVCRFLDLDSEFIPPNLGIAYNRTPRLRSRRLWSALERRRRGVGVERQLTSAVDRWNVRPAAGHPPLAPDLRARLLDHFREPNRALARRLDRDLSAWDR